MSSTAPVKILTVGAAVGSIREIFAKIKSIDAKHGKFDFALCTGAFFGPPDASNEVVTQLLDGEIEAPLECYIMQGQFPLPEQVIQKFAKTGGELCKNVFLLNKSGIITTANGLRIACLGGTYDPSVYGTAEAAPGFSSPFFSVQTMDKLLANTLAKASAKDPKNYSSLAAMSSNASSSQLVDILITNVWPSPLAQFSNVALPVPQLASIGVHALDDVIRQIKPRYHFAAGGGHPAQFWEREPFCWNDEEGRATRFVSLGSFGGEPAPGKKPRWFYAFSIAPNGPMTAPTPKPANATPNPFTERAVAPQAGHKRQLEGGGENYIFGNNVRQPSKKMRNGPDNAGKPWAGYKCRQCQSPEHFVNDCPDREIPGDDYVCKICSQPGHFVRDCPTKNAQGDTGGRKPPLGYTCRACASEAHYIDDCPSSSRQYQGGGGGGGEGRRGRRGPPREIAPGECWFCLSNPNLAKHLIVSIGTECYVTLPKGQLIPTQSATEVPSAVPGGGHVLIVPLQHCPTFSTLPEDERPGVIAETDKIKSALNEMYTAHGSTALSFEVGRLSAKGGHSHIQVMPVPLGMASKVEAAFAEEGRALGIDFEEDPEAAMAEAGAQRSYFRVELPGGKVMVHLMKDSVPFSIQFGRQVVANLLRTPERADWKACMLPEAEDTEDAKAFKEAFLKYDPTLL